MIKATFLMIALSPVMIGPPPAQLDEQAQKMLTIALCQGGAITLPLGKPHREPPAPCHAKACHGESCRKNLIQRKDGRSIPI